MKTILNAGKLTVRAVRAFMLFTLFSLLLGVGAASIAGFFSSLCTPFELASHFRVVYVCVFLSTAIGFFCLRQRWAATVASALLVINLAPIAYLNVPISSPSMTSHDDLDVLQLNLQGGKNKNYKKTLALIEKTNPDLIGLSELTGTWAKVLETNLTKYPYRVVEPERGGVALFSKFPISNSEVKYSGRLKRPRVVAQVNAGGQMFDVVLIHPVTPLKSRSMRNRERVEVANDARAFKNPGIVFGDMNTTPWSGAFAKLLQDGGLLDSERGFGFQPTWNCKMRISLLPIDHLLFTPQFALRERRVLGKVGSDHLPVFVKLAYSRSQS